MAHGGPPLSVSYQGLAGAFSEAAASALFPDQKLLPRRTFSEVFDALENGEVDAAVVPVENTHAGSVADVYDLLRNHSGVRIVAEAVVRVRHCLLAEDFLRTARIQPEVAYDTAGAAADIAASGDRTVAAVASRRAAERYGLKVLAESIETSPDNFTRFFALARDGDDSVAHRVPAALLTGPWKTSVVYAAANVPGALTRTLQPFATAGVQLTKIESRPSRAGPWDYVFYLDFEADPRTSPAREALALMRTCCEWVQPLGTYRAATTVLEPD